MEYTFQRILKVISLHSLYTVCLCNISIIVFNVTVFFFQSLISLFCYQNLLGVFFCLLLFFQAVINSTITPSMTFTKTSQKFGQWSDIRANTVYGLGFSSEAELNKVRYTFSLN